MNAEIIGLIAGVFTTGAAIPQIIKSYKIKEVRDISLLTYLLLVFGCVLWLLYGVASKSAALIFWNIAAISFNTTILIQKFYYSSKYKRKNTLRG
jgi:MtN3 and saliva related transmembrane protein